MGREGMEMCQHRCRAGKDGNPFWRGVHRATEVFHAISIPQGAHGGPSGLQIFSRSKVIF